MKLIRQARAEGVSPGNECVLKSGPPSAQGEPPAPTSPVVRTKGLPTIGRQPTRGRCGAAVRFVFVAAPSDIVVIGAGIVGCAIAHELARRGASVKIVDDRPVGM